MKRNKVTEKAQALAVKAFGENVEIHTSRDIYPNCYVCELVGIKNEYGKVVYIGGKELTPLMQPNELFAYLSGYLAGKEAAR